MLHRLHVLSDTPIYETILICETNFIAAKSIFHKDRSA